MANQIMLKLDRAKSIPWSSKHKNSLRNEQNAPKKEENNEKAPRYESRDW